MYGMIRKRMISLFLFGVCLSAVCMSNPQRIVFTPQWVPQSQFAGYYVALEKGFYREAGIELQIIHPSPSNPAINRLSSGKSDIITMQLLQALKTVDEGTDLVNILQTSQRNGFMIVSHEPLNGWDSLKGKKIGCWLSGFNQPAFLIDEKYELNIQWVPYVQNVNLFISGAVDAIMVMSFNEYFQLKAAGFEMKRENILCFTDQGYDIPEDGVYVTKEFFLKNPELVQRFAQASRRGWEWAAEHPEETLDMVMKQVKEHHVGTNRTIQKWMLDKILELQKEQKTGKSTFTLSPDSYHQAVRLLEEGRIISRSFSYSQFIGKQ